MVLKRIRYYVVALVLVVITVGGYIVWQQQTKSVPMLTEVQVADKVVVDEWYAPLFPMMIGPVPVEASVASTTQDRTKGLSNTPYLPEGVVKLFVFDESETWSFWMKDMNYSIDIIWIDDVGKIVHIEENVTPDSYPNSFVPNQSAKYVVETREGFVEEHSVVVGDLVVLPKGGLE